MARAIGALVQASSPARRRLPGRDQGDHGGERHLERGAGQRFGRDRQHDHRRPGDQPQRQGRAVEQDGEQGEARHGAGPLRRNRRAGERGVEQRRHQREHGRDLLGVDAQGERRHQGDAMAHQAHHQGDDEHDVQARDRQDVGETEVAHRLGDVLVDRGLLAGQERRDHAAFRAGQRLHDALDDIGPQRIDGAHEAVGLAGFDHRRGGQCIADGAKLLVPGDALEIEGAGCGRSGGRRDIGQHQDAVADMQRRCALGQRDTQLDRHHFRRRHAVALQAHGLEHDAPALGQALDVGDAAFDVDVEQRPAERRRGKACGAPGDQAEAHCRGDQADRHGAPEAARRREEHQPQRRRGQRGPQPECRLARQFEVEGDAKTQRHRQPQHPAAALGIELVQDPGTRPRHAVSTLRCLTVWGRSPTYGALFRPKCGKTRAIPEQCPISP